MTLTLEHKINNPLESYQKVADLYEVSKSSLYDRHTGVHSSHTASAPRHLSIVQEEELVKKINEYARRDTFLTPRHVVELAEAVYDGKLGVNWGSRFIQRHCDTIHSRFFSYQELGRLQADIPETRRAFYHLVCISQYLPRLFECFSQVKDVYDTGLYAPRLIFNMDEVAFELSALEGCAKLRLVPIQRMAKLYHRQMNTSHLWLASASILHQFLLSSSIKAHNCKKVGSRCGRRVTGWCASSLSTPTQAGSTAM